MFSKSSFLITSLIFSSIANSECGAEALVPFFTFLEKHGPSLKKIKFDGFDRLGELFTDEQAKKVGSLCPNLEFFDMWCPSQSKVPRNQAFFGRASDPDFQIPHYITDCSIKEATNKTWAQLSSPSITGLTSLAVFGGLTLETYVDDDTLDDPPITHQTDIVEVFKNNPKIKFCNLCYYDHQLQTIAPYLKNLTSLFWFAQDLTLETWKILGRELTALQVMRTLDCHRTDDTHMRAWVSEMPAGSELLTIEHRYSSVTPLCVAQDIAPHCPKLRNMNCDHKWTDEALYAWAKCPNKLYQVEFHEWETVSTEAVLEFIKGGGSELCKINFARVMELSDDFILTLVTHCRELAHLEIETANGVTKEGWEALKQLAPFKSVCIGADTCSREFLTSLCSNTPTKFFKSPAEKKAVEERKAAKKAAKEAEQRRQHQLAVEWGEKFFQEHKETLLQLCGDKINDVPTEALNLAKNCTTFPEEMQTNRGVFENTVKVEGMKLKGELMRKAAEQKRKEAEEKRKQAVEAKLKAAEEKAKGSSSSDDMGEVDFF